MKPRGFFSGKVMGELGSAVPLREIYTFDKRMLASGLVQKRADFSGKYRLAVSVREAATRIKNNSNFSIYKCRVAIKALKWLASVNRPMSSIQLRRLVKKNIKPPKEGFLVDWGKSVSGGTFFTTKHAPIGKNILLEIFSFLIAGKILADVSRKRTAANKKKQVADANSSKQKPARIVSQNCAVEIQELVQKRIFSSVKSKDGFSDVELADKVIEVVSEISKKGLPYSSEDIILCIKRISPEEQRALMRGEKVSSSNAYALVHRKRILEIIRVLKANEILTRAK